MIRLALTFFAFVFVAACVPTTTQTTTTGRATTLDFVSVNGRISDDAFYKLVACAAAPGQSCRRPILKWAASDLRDLTVGVTLVDEGFRPYKVKEVSRVLPLVMAEISAASPSVRMRLATPRSADIQIFLIDQPIGTVIRGTGSRGVDGARADGANYRVRLNSKGNISSAGIAVNMALPTGEVHSVLLEELVQVLGLGTDIEGAAYKNASVFAQSSNSVTVLRGQDRMALRRHTQ